MPPLYIGLIDPSVRNYLFVDGSPGPYYRRAHSLWRKDDEMNLRLATRGIELTADLNDYIKRRVHFAMGRFAGKIKSVSIRLVDVNGPRGGIDKCCDIRVNVGLRREVIVREQQASIHAAIAFAVERADRAVQRQFESANSET
jgi:putative sigma-54 modulation protein